MYVCIQILKSIGFAVRQGVQSSINHHILLNIKQLLTIVDGGYSNGTHVTS